MLTTLARFTALTLVRGMVQQAFRKFFADINFHNPALFIRIGVQNVEIVGKAFIHFGDSPTDGAV